ncbi:S-layer homology domain-containing protein [Alteribacillus sp. YIM 98480]|uniref:S-layer homology domain-containing protein n=1 Tax=Alteribacillus sp. YIM 98480 TaxID=2606599 RepID=UPI00131CA6E8|nr:S-layer homology domain-containing protein [Alteribacillus sp. YIM 98480]
MYFRMKGLLLGASLLGAVILAGCSEAEADQSEEAASADWTEEQAAEVEGDIDDTEQRLDDLEKDLQSLGGEPSFSDEPIFPDVAGDFHAFEEIQFLASEGIISGFSDGYFRPSETITRAQTAKMLTSALDLDAPDDYEMQAEDVSKENHAYDQLAALEYHGIMKGNDGQMMPGEGLKRSQMAALLVSAYDLPDAQDVHSFTDIDENYPNFEQINIIADQQITSEAGEAFRPNETTTRAQFSLFMSRTMDDYFKE